MQICSEKESRWYSLKTEAAKRVYVENYVTCGLLQNLALTQKGIWACLGSVYKEPGPQGNHGNSHKLQGRVKENIQVLAGWAAGEALANDPKRPPERKPHSVASKPSFSTSSSNKFKGSPLHPTKILQPSQRRLDYANVI